MKRSVIKLLLMIIICCFIMQVTAINTMFGIDMNEFGHTVVIRDKKLIENGKYEH